MPRRFTAHAPPPAKGAGSRPEQVAGKAREAVSPVASEASRPKEIGGPEGPEPTRYGDWERKGICVDF